MLREGKGLTLALLQVRGQPSASGLLSPCAGLAGAQVGWEGASEKLFAVYKG